MPDQHHRTTTGSPPTPTLEVRELVKTFGTVRANDGISFTIMPGEVHALLGENGAGKSTLVKSLYGVHQPDSGQILRNGEPVTIHSPATARELGIGMVFQDMRLIPALTVWENVALHLSDTPFALRPRALRARITETSERYGLATHPGRKVEHLSIGEWQRVELVKVLLGGLDMLILDEPTSVLTPQEVSGLFDMVARLKSEGVAIVIITHKLREVRQIADKVTVLRGGRTILSDAPPATLSDDELITAMVGEPVAILEKRSTSAEHATAEPIIGLSGVSVRRVDGDWGLREVSLEVLPGQILGVAGVAGSGQDELSETLLGLRQPHSGTVMLDGAIVELPAVARMRKAGVIAVAPDPIRQFVVPGMSVAEHAALWNAAGSYSFDTRKADADLARRDAAGQLRVVAGSRRMDRLSGGNVQRALLTLALTSPCRVLVASYPTRGLDILTTERTRTLLKELCEAGSAVVLISEDLDELLTLSDRIAVLAGGRLTGIVPAAAADRRSIGELMTGKEAAA
ncbi:ATP-binding cassette domain-containing protein [Gryllotalpicola sp.]|uniref:ABC transporter ATP-binding protein n=1 Tax=Gryllotalpicola sp. TaxID=1932787 RepID=UPI0026333BD0|nr:ATP-binding cassette domain-containing protein [Gryllotalpicola sp.]